MKIISQAFIFLWLQLLISNSIASDVEYTLAKIPDFSLGKSYEYSSGKTISHSPVIIFDVFADEYLYILVTNNKKSEQPYAQLDWKSVKITHPVFGDVTTDLLYNMGQESDEVNTDDEIYINHSPFNTKYISQVPYVFEFKVDFCASVDARNDCIEPKKLKSKFQFYILSTADVAEFSPPDLTLDMLFYIDKDGEPRISGYEFLNETIELVNYLSSDNFDELKESAKGAANTLEDLIPGIGNLISNDLKAPTDLKSQIEFKKDVGNFAFLASRRVDELTQREIDQARDFLSKYEDEIDNIKDNLPPTHIPSEETDCKGSDACQVYIAVNGRFNLSAEFYGDYQSKKQKGVKENSALLSIRSIDEENPVATDITVTIGANTKFEDKFNTPKFQLFKKNFIQFVPTPVGIPIVFTENLGIYAEIEVEGGLEASSEVAIRFEREDLFMAGVGWKSNKVDINGELCGEEASANKNIIIYKCRNDLKSAITIQGNVVGEANVKATMRIYPEVEFMVYRNAGATVSLEPGIYADASIYGKASFEKELDVIGGDNPDTDSVLAFNSLELGVNGRAGFRADFGVILSDETFGVTYPVCAGVCERTKRDYINLGEYPLYNLPSTNFLSYVGFLGGSSVIKADFKEGVNFFSDNGNPVKGYQFQLIDPAGDVLATDTTEVVSDSPITQVIQDIDILDEGILEAGSEYKVRLYYWSALGKYISKAEEISIFYSPPIGELNTQVITQQEGYARVSWDAISQATDYWIYRDGVIVATFPTGQTSYEYIDSTVQSGESYQYQVVPVSGNGVNFKQPVISFPEALSFSIQGAATAIVDQDYSIALELTNDGVCTKSFEIDWGDNSSLQQGSALGDDCLINTALNFSHQYEEEGTYQIIAELTDNLGETALAYHTVDVSKPIKDITAGLVAHYEFENNPSDSSGNENNGVESGGVTYAEGVVGQSVYFDGVDGYIDVPHSEVLTLQEYTLSVWVNADSNTPFDSLLLKGRYNGIQNGNNQREYNFTFNSAAYHGVDSRWYSVSISETPPHDKWILLTASFDGEVLTVYKNGILSDQLETSVDINVPISPESLTIGSAFDVNNGSIGNQHQAFKGSLDDLRIYNRALSEQEISELYKLGATPSVTPIGTLNDTGIIVCADFGGGHNFSNNELNCASVSSTQELDGYDSRNIVPAGQDAHFGRDSKYLLGTLEKVGIGRAAFDFSKIDYNGNVLENNAPDWSCVRDNVTGLIWENPKNSNWYTWYDSSNLENTGDENSSSDKCFGHIEGDGSSYCNTEAHIVRASNSNLCGHANWRLPTGKELVNLFDYGKTFRYSNGPLVRDGIDMGLFQNIERGRPIWCDSTLERYDDGYACSFSLSEGAPRESVTSSSRHYLILVNGEQNIKDYKVTSDQTVLDDNTGLLWKSCAEGLYGEGCVSGSLNRYSWHDALRHAIDSEYSNYTDWRVPSIKELASLVYYSNNSALIDEVAFPNTPQCTFLSSSADLSDPQDKRYLSISFPSGVFSFGYKHDSNQSKQCLLLVRDSE